MKFTAHLSRNSASLSMPVAGTILKLPALDDLGLTSSDVIEDWPGDYSNSFRLAYDWPENSITYQTQAFGDELSKLEAERERRQIALSDFKKEFENLSLTAIIDPFEPGKQKDVSRMKNTIQLIISLLWNDEISALAEQIPEEQYPVLETRISKILTNGAIEVCSALISLDQLSTRKLACRELAIEIRRRELFDGFYSDEIAHPTATFQKLKINDPVFYQPHTVYLDCEHLNVLLFTHNKIGEYWNKLAEKKLYNQRDILTLKQWGVIADKENGVADLLAVPAVALSPADKLGDAYGDLYAIRAELFDVIKFVKEVGYVGFKIWLSNGWPAGIENRSLWVAQRAAENLGLDVSVAEKYGSTFSGLLPKILSYVYTPNNAEKDQKNRDKDGNQVMDLVFAGESEALLNLVLPHAVSDHVCEYMQFNAKSIFGGTIIKLIRAYLPVDLEKDPLILRGRIFDVPESVEIYNDLLLNPSIFEDQINKLRTWRDNFERNNSRRSTQISDMVVDGFYHVNTTKSFLEKSRKSFDEVFSKIEKLRVALSNVDTLTNIQKVYDGVKEKLGSGYLDVGKLKLPVDTRVCSVFVSVGEFVAEGKPVVSFIDRFRCNVRVFLSDVELQASRIMPMSVWRVAINGLSDLPGGVFFSGIINRIEPTDKGIWLLEMDLVASLVIEVEGVSNLPVFFPLSSRFRSVVPELTEDILMQAEMCIGRFTTAEIELLKKIY